MNKGRARPLRPARPEVILSAHMKKKSRENNRPRLDDKRRFDRRTFVKFLPAVGVAAYVDAPLALAQTAQQAQPQQPQRVSKEAMHAAEQLIGIELNDAQEAMALPGVNRNLASYEALRKIEVPLD